MTSARSITDPSGVRQDLILSPKVCTAKRVKDTTFTLNSAPHPERVSRTVLSIFATFLSVVKMMQSSPSRRRFLTSSSTPFIAPNVEFEMIVFIP